MTIHIRITQTTFFHSQRTHAQNSSHYSKILHNSFRTKKTSTTHTCCSSLCLRARRYTPGTKSADTKGPCGPATRCQRTGIERMRLQRRGSEDTEMSQEEAQRGGGRMYMKCSVEYVDRAHMYGYNLRTRTQICKSKYENTRVRCKLRIAVAAI